MDTSIERIYRQVANGSLSKAEALALLRQLRPPVAPAPSTTISPSPEQRPDPSQEADTTSTPASTGAVRARKTLLAPALTQAVGAPSTQPRKRTLAPPSASSNWTAQPAQEKPVAPLLADQGNGVYSLRLNPDAQGLLTPTHLAVAAGYLTGVQHRDDAKVVLLSAGPKLFAGLTTSEPGLQGGADLLNAVKDCSLPILLVLEGDTVDLGFLAAALGDLVVCGAPARLGFSSDAARQQAREGWTAFLRERFGPALATRLLAAPSPLSSAELRELGLGIEVVAAGNAERRATELAHELSQSPRLSLTLLKRHLTGMLHAESQREPIPEAHEDDLLLSLQRGSQPVPGERCQAGPASAGSNGFGVEIAFPSKVVRLSASGDGVLLARLEDRAARNAFSPALTRGIQDLFEFVRTQPEYKVLVLTGHGQYFATGGTKEGLLSIQRGATRYSDAPLYELPLRCDIPVIGAVQGHAVGAGWAFALFADLVVCAEDCLYSSRFMRYGFTPGFGSTLIFPERFGWDLGREVLFTARDYLGRDLRERGAGMPVVPQAEVLPLALAQAHRLALHPRDTLVRRKRASVRRTLERIPGVVQAELAMHERTFVGNAEALQEIEARFDSRATKEPTDLPAEARPETTSAVELPPEDDLLSALRTMLAEELSLTPDAIEEDIPFTDLGLDSITGVSWVRRIGKRYGLSLSANEVYQAPTLGEFALWVRNRLGSARGAAPPAESRPTLAAAQPPPAPPEQPVHHPPAETTPGTLVRPTAEAMPAAHARTASRERGAAVEIESDSTEERSPLSEGQRGLWLLQRLDPDMAAYNVPVAFRIRDEAWSAGLEETIEALRSHHPLLSAAIGVDEQGQPYQYVPRLQRIRLERKTIAANTDEAVLAHLTEAFKRPYALNHDPLLRVTLYTDRRGQQFALFTLHHLIFDGTSLAIFLRDLLEFWSQAVRHRRPTAGTTPRPAFFDFARWEQSYLQSSEGAQDLAYWKEQLAGDLPVSEFPADRTRSPRRAYAGATLSSPLPAALTQQLKALAKRRQTSLFTLLLSIYNVLLARYARQDTVVVGVPVARRPEARFKEELGYYVNMVAIRSGLGGDTPFTAYLEELKWTVLAALDHSRYPFARLVSDLRIEPSPIRSPLFQTVFVLQNFLPQAGFLDSAKPGLGVDPLSGLHQEGEYDVRFEVVDRAEALEVSVSFDTDVFEAPSVRLLIQHFEVLAEAIVNHPEGRLADLGFLSPPERERVEVAWNPSRPSAVSSACLHQVFEQRVADRPEAVALVWASGQYTYRELHARSTALAVWLQTQGVGPEDRVALCLNRSPELVTAVLGVLQAGAAYVPIDPDYPADRVAFLLEDCGAKVALTNRRGIDRLPRAGVKAVPAIRLDDDWTRIVAESAGRTLARAVAPSHLAYILYTSGSTGKPKGVMVEHRQALSTLRFLQEAYPVDSADTYLFKTSVAFDVSLTELFGWFLGAGRLALLAEGEERLPDRIAEAIRRWQVTHINFVPSALGVFLESLAPGGEGKDLTSLKYVMVAGEAFPKTMVAEAVAAFPGARVENLYGPTEASIYASVYSCDAGVRSVHTPIGRATGNARLYVLDRWRRSTGIGVPGELAIGGEGVARGYWNRPDLTAASFVDSPFEPGTRLFLTGDLVRWLPEGQIEYFGRIDQQVKIRGFRVEPGEIEGLLNQHPAVQTSVVVAVGQGANRRLVAYFVPKPGASGLEPGGLAAPLQAKLPDYMVPQMFQPLESIPLTASGKIDRRALAQRELRLEPHGAACPPQGAVEEQIAALWKELLQLDSVSTTDRFFEVGGNSLLAVLLADRLSRRFGRPVPAATVFKHSTIQAIARELAPPEGAGGASPPTGRPRPTPECYPALERGATPTPDDAVAIVGISCAFPGASDLEQFWSMLREGRTGGRFLTPEELRQRGLPEELIRDPKFVPLSLAVEDKELFDAEFFNVPARNALLMDPQIRQLLTHAWRAVEDAGYDARTIPDTGVFMSAGQGDYQRALDRSGAVEATDAYPAWVFAQGGTLPALISYTLGFTGPSLFVHTNCSSSLAGLYLACQSLRAGQARYALVGGATLFTPSREGYLHRPGLNFSSDGRCKAFDADADGMVGSEGVAVLLLKRASAAFADGDAVYALIRGVAMNNDGPERAGFYSPGTRGQTSVIAAALRESRVNPESIGYLEAHGTGTRLGDPIEVMALTDAYRRHTSRTGFCGLGSVKSNIGHADTAAGLAGCVKLALSLRAGLMAPSVNYRSPNPAIDFAASPFYVVDRLTPWPRGAAPRRGALSSFGIGGSNVHAILEECPDADPRAEEAAGPWPILLSARDPGRLRESIARLRRHLEEHPALCLADAAYTLAVGRRPLACRVAFLAATRVDLLVKLDLAGAPNARGDGFWFGALPDRPGENLLDSEDTLTLARQWLDQRRLDKLARLWVRGADFDWSGLFDCRRRRVHLPTYPFAKERFSLGIDGQARHRDTPSAQDEVPLRLRNVSSLGEFAFTTVLTGDEFFLTDHRVSGRRLLPGVVLLELARAAAEELAYGPQPTASTRRKASQLRDVVWLRPCHVEDGARTLRVTLTPSGPDRLQIEIRVEAGEGGATVLCRALALLAAPEEAPGLDLAALRAGIASDRVRGTECYGAFASAGFDYGAGFQAVQELALGGGQALVRLELPAAVRSTHDAYPLHPSLLDGALQGCALLALRSRPLGEPQGTDRSPTGPPLGLPFAAREVRLLRPCPTPAWAWVRAHESERGEGRLRKFDLDIADEQGNVCVQVRGYCTRASDSSSSPQPPGVLHLRPVWQAKPAPASRASSPAAQRLVWTCGIPPLNGAGLDCRHTDGPGTADRWGDWFLDVAGQVFQEVKAALRRKSNTLLQLVLPTRGPESCLAAVSALFRTAHLEDPRFFGQVVEVSPGPEPRSLLAKLDDDIGCLEDVHIRHSGEGRSVWVWTEVEPTESTPAYSWRDGGVYVITGGAGGLGRIFARDILARAPRARVVLLGRSPAPSPSLRDEEIPADRVSYHAADLARWEEVESAIARLRQTHGKIDGVLHAAGIVGDSFIVNKSAEAFRAVLAPKVLGAIHAERLAQALGAPFLALFSSGVARFGAAGQADYATANAFLDRLALLRHGNGDGPRIVALDWPLWEEGGMRAGESRLAALRRSGMVALPSAAGLQAFAEVLASGEPQRMVLAGDAPRLRAFLTDVGSVPAAAPTQPTEPAPAVEADFQARVSQWVRQIVADVVKRSPDRLAADTPFEKFGIDSILQVSIVEKLQEATGELAQTLLFEYTTLSELTRYLLQEHATALHHHLDPASQNPPPTSAPALRREPELAPAIVRERPEPEPELKPEPGPVDPREAIAIIGVAGRYPLADSLEELWENLKQGTNCVSRADPNRWPASAKSNGSSNGGSRQFASPHGGFLREVDRFDHALFDVPVERVWDLSPETRLFLEVVWETFEDAGYSRAALRAAQRESAGVGVYVGVMYNQYPWLFPGADQAAIRSNATEWHIANRVSHFFDLTGPSLALNSACSSSLLAIHLASESLRQGGCSMALAGGVNLTLHPSKYDFLEAAKMLDTGAVSRGFGAGKGYVPGEGVGAVLLKPLAAAARDGDRILAIIRGSLASHAGGRQVYTAPDPRQQTRLIADCLRRSAIDPQTIGYVESAANGSPLGDPIEVLALKKAFGESPRRAGACALGSVKSNLGHLEAASGISQLTKVLLQLQHRTFVPSIHSQPRNPAIRLEGSPFFIPEICVPWPALRDTATGAILPRRCLIDSIGAGGTCVSLVVEEHLPAHPHDAPPAPLGTPPLVLSAATPASLRASARRLAAYLREHASLDLAQVALALYRREPLAACRAAVAAASPPEAVRLLDRLGAQGGHAPDEGLYVAEQRASASDPPSLPVAGNAPAVLAAHWVAGGGLEWDYTGGTADLPDLPKYAFDHARSFAVNRPLPSPTSRDEAVAQRVARGEMSFDAFESYLRQSTSPGSELP